MNILEFSSKICLVHFLFREVLKYKMKSVRKLDRSFKTSSFNLSQLPLVEGTNVSERRSLNSSKLSLQSKFVSPSSTRASRHNCLK